MNKNVMKSAALVMLFAAICGGCKHGGVNYPEIPSAKGTKQDPNSPASESAMVAALQFVANRYPPGKLREDAPTAREAGEVRTSLPMAVNLPAGLRKSFYDRIARKVGDHVVPVSGETDAGLPVYHVTRVWLRFKEGWVDVMRPMPELPPGPDGKPIYQTVTLKMEGGFAPSWRVVHARAWEPGLDPIPELYYIPDEDRINQYNLTVHGEGSDYNRKFESWEADVKGTRDRREQLQEAPVETFDQPK